MLDCCEEVWNGLRSGEPVPTQQTDAFVAMLSDKRALGIAREVIPPLREGFTGGHLPLACHHILSRLGIASMHDDFSIQRPLDGLPTEPLHAGEKESFAEAEMYRAELLLYGTGSVSREEKDAVRRWLHARPKITPKATTVGKKRSAREMDVQVTTSGAHHELDGSGEQEDGTGCYGATTIHI